MKIYKAYKYELDPNNHQGSAMLSHCGASRFVYNWGLALIKSEIESSNYTVGWSLPSLRKRWNQIKHDIAPWWSNNSKEVYSSGLQNLAEALESWKNSRDGLRKGARLGFPKYKKKGARDSARFYNGAIRVYDSHHIVLPRLGKLRTKEPTDKLSDLLSSGNARILFATISRVANKWFVSFNCEVEKEDLLPKSNSKVVGIDVGIKNLAVMADSAGEFEWIENLQPLKKSLKKLKKIGRKLARQKRGSRRRNKTKIQLSKTHARISNERKDYIHKLTSRIASKYRAVVVEKLNIQGIAKNKRLSRSIYDSSLWEIKRQLKYKLEWNGGILLEAQTFYPSSKTCNRCKVVKTKLLLSERIFQCENPDCKWSGDRDLNAALNLRDLARSVTPSTGETLNARGLAVSLDSDIKQLRQPRNIWMRREAGKTEMPSKTSSFTPKTGVNPT